MLSPLLTLEQIADLHRCSLRHARDVLVKLPGFPSESPSSTPRNRRWVLSEVEAFVTRRDLSQVARHPLTTAKA